MPKALVVVLAVIISAAALIKWGFIFLFFFPLYFGIEQYLFLEADLPANKVETSLTVEQRLSDFDYMYELVCLENPRKEMFEEAYGISYDDIYNTYREYIVNAETDFEYFAYMADFLAVLPGEHNYMALPEYEFDDIMGFDMCNVYGTQEIKDYITSWHEDFRDDVESYSDCSLIVFRYIDGKYVGAVPTKDTLKYVSDYDMGQIISIDGKDPRDMCFDFLERTVPVYDSGNDCFFRNYLLFNDCRGVKHTAEILMPDGTTVTADLYKDPAFEVAYFDGPSAYPAQGEDQPADTGDEDTETPVVDVWSDDYVPETYSIYADETRKLVYLNSISCETYEGERLVRDFNEAVEQADADTVILDLRNNGGGEIDFCTTQLLPALFSHDQQFASPVIGGVNPYTSKMYDSIFQRMVLFYYDSETPQVDSDYYYYSDHFDVTGNAVRDFKIYVLTSQQTFSSGDIITNLCKEYDNAVIVGTNTEGEGLCGSPLNCYLPESRFAFVYVPSVNVDHPENSYYGTEPDVYVHYTLDDYNAKQELNRQGMNTSEYETRLLWDHTLLTVLDMIDAD